ncbi:MAG: hypothetical protein IKT04_01055 [Clostridia bacterium]|nr:hypothetical protein [Clostridia bacterium]MBR6479077.1 hypothetical protein [Clostridia bacterium]
MVPEILNIADFPGALAILIGATIIDLSIVGVAFKDFLSKGEKKEEPKEEPKE